MLNHTDCDWREQYGQAAKILAWESVLDPDVMIPLLQATIQEQMPQVSITQLTSSVLKVSHSRCVIEYHTKMQPPLNDDFVVIVLDLGSGPPPSLTRVSSTTTVSGNASFQMEKLSEKD